ncbi:FAD-dependent monooxygenase [Umezawaea sp. Da 62-37]|uniref:FAD-dependent monooxygenase n=1 Tax=Umezawaea sp. Da 62-37 TaxID=3075927 RepID=UPI0028F71A7B|nr:FAD-dependent monooxygenase [Umezawaea sp. Da 62-37]WNV84460.1 FAD-dependent monooxygenase [Umezawaea sp. Da 62-37]
MTTTVVGAGPTGLALACGLLGAGVPVRLVDAAQGPAVTSRALGLQPRGVEVLDRLGALGDLPDRSIGVDRIAIVVGGKPLGELKVGQVTKLVKRPGLLISQAEVEGELRRRFTDLGGAVEWGTALTGVTQDDHGVLVTTSDGGQARTDWLVGCDGAHSAVRKAVGIGFPGVPLVERFLLADAHVDLPHPRDAVAVWLDGEDMLAAFPLPGTDLWRLMAPAPAGFPDDGDIAAIMGESLRERASLPEAEVKSTDWTSSFRFHRRLADTYRVGRVLLAGDAAHIHSPFGGQGMNTGLGDAENLAWKLALVASGHAETSLLDTYEGERRPVAEGVLSSTSGMTKLMVGGGLRATLLRDRVAVPMMNRGFVQKAIWERSSQLRISYRRGPLGGHRFGRGLRPGDRVPDRPVVLDGHPDRLHALLGHRWVLFGGEQSAAVARKRLGEERVVVLPADGDATLIRPDGHLAWRGQEAPGVLDGRLTGILGG